MCVLRFPFKRRLPTVPDFEDAVILRLGSMLL